MDEIYRILCAMMIGFILSSAGSLSQLLTQNPLASPSTIGIQAMALFSLISGFFISKYLELSNYVFLAFLVFGVIALLWIFFLNQKKVKSGSFFKKLIFIGICLNLLVGAIYSLLQFILLNLGQQFPSELWFGSLKFLGQEEFLAIGSIFTLYFIMIFYFSKNLRLFMLGRDFAAGQISSIEESEKYIFFMMFLAVGISTIYCGIFSFVGLIFPHLFRSFAFFRKDIHKEVILGGLFSGILFMLLDLFCYHLPIRGAEIPVGMVVSTVFPLVFLCIYLKNNNSIDSLY